MIFLVPDETFIRRGGVISTPTAHHMFSCTVFQRSAPSLLSQFVLQVAVILSDLFHAHAWLKHNMKLGTLCLAPKVFTRHVIRHTLEERPSPGTCTLSLTRPTSASSFSYDPLSSEVQPCADLRQFERGSLAELPTFALCAYIAVSFPLKISCGVCRMDAERNQEDRTVQLVTDHTSKLQSRGHVGVPSARPLAGAT